jgi:predicted dehydrogenase
MTGRIGLISLMLFLIASTVGWSNKILFYVLSDRNDSGGWYTGPGDVKITVLEPDKEPIVTTEDGMPQVVEPIDNFIAAILGKAKPLASGVDGLRVVEFIEGAYKSARTKRAIAL